MSMLDTIGRYGAAIKQVHARGRAVRMLNGLPADFQKDIGWPVSPRANERATLLGVIWSAAR